MKGVLFAGKGIGRTGIAVCLSFALSLSVTGCSNIHDDSTRTKTEGTLTGAGIGAAGGALLGLIIGGNTKGTRFSFGLYGWQACGRQKGRVCQKGRLA